MNDKTNKDAVNEGLPRRQFLGTVGAGAVLAAGGFSGCIRKPVEHILPYATRPEDLIPGKPLFYATVMNIGGHVQGLIVESHEGRPTKIEGNPSHPGTQGATDVFAQASVADLYDPDRITGPWSGDAPSDWASADDFLGGLHSRIKDAKGEGLAILTMSLPSPTALGLMDQVAKSYPSTKFYRHDLTSRSQTRTSMALVGAAGHMPSYDLSAASIVLTVDADPLYLEGDTVAHARGYAAGRSLCDSDPSKMARYYAVEARLSMAGQNADHRLRVRSSRIPSFLAALAHRLVKKGLSLPAGAALPPDAPADSPRAETWLDAVADDLLANRGRSLVIVGDRQGAQANALGHLLNVALGNEGRTVRYPHDSEWAGAGSLEDLATSVSAGGVKQLVILGGDPAHTSPATVDFRALLATVPLSVYLGQRRDATAVDSTWHFPQAHYLEAWGDLQDTNGVSSIQQPLIAPLHGRAMTETEVLSALLEGPGRTAHELVRAHWRSTVGAPSAEATARVRAAAATLAAASTQLADLLAATPGDDEGLTGRKLRRAQKERETQVADARAAVTKAESGAKEADANLKSDAAKSGLGFERAWRKALHDGAFPASNAKVATPSWQWKSATIDWPAPGGDHTYEVDFVLSGTLLDGRFGNNGWMQEVPDPVTKLTWDNAAVMNSKTAEEIGVAQERLLRVATSEGQLTLPVRVIVGIADGTIVLPLGYGADQSTGGRVGGGVGVNTNKLRSSSTQAWAVATEVTPVTATGMTTELAEYPLGITQRQTSLTAVAEGGVTSTGGDTPGGFRRPFARVATVSEYQKDPRFVMNEELPMFVKDDPKGRRLDEEKIRSLWEEPNQRTGHQWGMTIDLNSCIGCNACSIACQAENNISVVGKEEVLNGREMHWVRMDQYFDGDDDEPQAIFQPLGCVHCENAPCEQVCPVGATTHSPEGLNDMAYNRCIGTRYCANNCPFKVRRFNYYNYTRRNDEARGPISHMQRNPDVTVRFRGVIEKCTYCVQRVNQARIDAKRDGDGVIADGAIDPACGQSCPTKAITFGDINDETTVVAGMKAHPRNYDLLGEMNLYPRTSYLARIRNPNPKLS